MTSSSPQCTNMFSSSSMTNFKPCRRSLVSQLLKRSKIDCARAKVNCDLQIVKPQDFFAKILIFKDNSSFYQGLIMIHQGLLITFSYFMRNDPSKAHFEEDAISNNPSSHPKIKKCSHKKLQIWTL